MSNSKIKNYNLSSEIETGHRLRLESFYVCNDLSLNSNLTKYPLH